jgi:hypothetical protein
VTVNLRAAEPTASTSLSSTSSDRIQNIVRSSQDFLSSVLPLTRRLLPRTMFRPIVALALLALVGSVVAVPTTCDPLLDPSCNGQCIGAEKECTNLGTLTCCPGTRCQIDVGNSSGVSREIILPSSGFSVLTRGSFSSASRLERWMTSARAADFRNTTIFLYQDASVFM